MRLNVAAIAYIVKGVQTEVRYLNVRFPIPHAHETSDGTIALNASPQHHAIASRAMQEVMKYRGTHLLRSGMYHVDGRVYGTTFKSCCAKGCLQSWFRQMVTYETMLKPTIPTQPYLPHLRIRTRRGDA